MMVEIDDNGQQVSVRNTLLNSGVKTPKVKLFEQRWNVCGLDDQKPPMERPWLVSTGFCETGDIFPYAQPGFHEIEAG